MNVESIIIYKTNVLPHQFDQRNDLTSSSSKKHRDQLIFEALGQKVNELLDRLSFNVNSYRLENFILTEHPNPINQKFSRFAKISYQINHFAEIYDDFEKFSGNFSWTISRMPDQDLFEMLEDGTSTDFMFYNPCNSPFENDCDAYNNAVCIGVENNKWLRYPYGSASGNETAIRNLNNGQQGRDYNEYFSCTCKNGYIDQRISDGKISGFRDRPNFYVERRGLVCIDNKYDEKYLNNAMRGGIAMTCFLGVVMIVMFGICFGTRERRNSCWEFRKVDFEF